MFVGLDEPADLFAEDPREDPSVYLDWLKRLRDLPVLDGRQMVVCNDVLADHPETLASLPQGVTVCEWGYGGDHDFAGQVAGLAQAGVPFWVCPSTSVQRSIVGRVSSARANLDAAAAAGLELGAPGFFNTDWGHPGHRHFPPVRQRRAWPWALRCPGATQPTAISISPRRSRLPRPHGQHRRRAS